MSGNIVTREFSIDDYDGALQLWQRVEGLEVAEGDDREGVAQFLARNPGVSRVAIDESAVVGVAMCGHDGRRGHIYHLAVDPAYRGCGLGKRLVEECLERLRAAGVVRSLVLSWQVSSALYFIVILSSSFVPITSISASTFFSLYSPLIF